MPGKLKLAGEEKGRPVLRRRIITSCMLSYCTRAGWAEVEKVHLWEDQDVDEFW